MTQHQSPMIAAKFLVATNTIKELLSQINTIENDNAIFASEKLNRIREIRKEIQRVSAEVDAIKNEVKLLNTCTVN